MAQEYYAGVGVIIHNSKDLERHTIPMLRWLGAYKLEMKPKGYSMDAVGYIYHLYIGTKTILN